MCYGQTINGGCGRTNRAKDTGLLEAFSYLFDNVLGRVVFRIYVLRPSSSNNALYLNKVPCISIATSDMFHVLR